MQGITETVKDIRSWAMAVVIAAAAIWADVREEIDSQFAEAGVEVKCPGESK